MQIYLNWKKFTRNFLSWRRLDIGRGDVVLDVGCGHKPLPRADILCDKFPWDDTDRQGGIPVDRPLVVGDCLRLPFADKSVDYVYCRSVIEHLPDPEPLLREVMRVGRKGLIGAPSALYEKIIPNYNHHWFITIERGILVLRQKPNVIFDRTLADFSYRHAHQKAYRTFMERYWNEMALTFEWKGSFRYEIVRDAESVQPDGFMHAKSWDTKKEKQAIPALGWKQWLLNAAGRWIRAWHAGPAPDLGRLLVCPDCHTALVAVTAEYACTTCRKAYPIDGGFPVLLAEAARPLTEAVHIDDAAVTPSSA